MRRFITSLVVLLALGLIMPVTASKKQGCTAGYKVTGWTNRNVEVNGAPANPQATYGGGDVMTITGSGEGSVTLVRVMFPAYCSGGKINYIESTGVGLMAIWIDE